MRTGNISDADVKLLQSRENSIQKLRNDVNTLFAENGPKGKYNYCMELERNS